MIRKPQYILLAILPLISMSGCLLLAAGAGGEAGYVASQSDRTAGETIDDQRITASVKTKLIGDPDVSGLSINVDTFKRVVTLHGVVKSEREAQKAVELAETVAGVRRVDSKLFVE